MSQYPNKVSNPASIAGLAIRNKTAQALLEELSVRLYPLTEDKDGIIGFMIYTKQNVSLSNLTIREKLISTFLRMNKKEKYQLYHTMSMIMMSDYAFIVMHECMKHNPKDKDYYCKVRQILIENFENNVEQWNRHFEFLLMNTSAYKETQSRHKF